METYFGYGIIEWTYMVHTNISNNYEMIPFELDPNGYAYHSYADILITVLPVIKTDDIIKWIRNNLIIDEYCKLAHSAWCANYIYWKNKEYTKVSRSHKKGINTSERNDRATTNYENLNQSDLELYTDIINEVFNILSKRVLELGMQSLSVN